MTEGAICDHDNATDFVSSSRCCCRRDGRGRAVAFACALLHARGRLSRSRVSPLSSRAPVVVHVSVDSPSQSPWPNNPTNSVLRRTRAAYRRRLATPANASGGEHATTARACRFGFARYAEEAAARRTDGDAMESAAGTPAGGDFGCALPKAGARHRCRASGRSDFEVAAVVVICGCGCGLRWSRGQRQCSAIANEGVGFGDHASAHSTANASGSVADASSTATPPNASGCASFAWRRSNASGGGVGRLPTASSNLLCRVCRPHSPFSVFSHLRQLVCRPCGFAQSLLSWPCRQAGPQA